jgi:hypothetical protein
MYSSLSASQRHNTYRTIYYWFDLVFHDKLSTSKSLHHLIPCHKVFCQHDCNLPQDYPVIGLPVGVSHHGDNLNALQHMYCHQQVSMDAVTNCFTILHLKIPARIVLTCTRLRRSIEGCKNT